MSCPAQRDKNSICGFQYRSKKTSQQSQKGNPAALPGNEDMMNMGTGKQENNRSRILLLWALLMAGMSVLFSCIDIEPAKDEEKTSSKDLSLSDYKVVDSGFWVGSDKRTFWLDNHRVLFRTKPSLSPEGGSKSILAAWDTSTGKIDFAHAWHIRNRVLCVKKEKFVYIKRDESFNWTYHQGTLKQSEPYPPPLKNMTFDRFFDCRWEIKPHYITGDYTYRTTPLCGENYLEIVREVDDPTPVPGHHKEEKNYERPAAFEVEYYSHKGAKGILLPIRFGGISGCDFHNIRYMEWKNAYFLSTSQYYDDVPLKVYWLDTQGQLSKIELPKELPFPETSPISIYPVRAGLLVLIGGYPKGPGAYLVTEKKAIPLINYPVNIASISPDGCKASFAHTTNMRKFGYWRDKDRTIKIIDFCAKDR